MAHASRASAVGALATCAAPGRIITAWRNGEGQAKGHGLATFDGGMVISVAIPPHLPWEEAVSSVAVTGLRVRTAQPVASGHTRQRMANMAANWVSQNTNVHCSR